MGICSLNKKPYEAVMNNQSQLQRHQPKGLVRQLRLRRAKYRKRQLQKSKNRLYRTPTPNWSSWEWRLRVRRIKSKGQLRIKQIWLHHKRTKASKAKDHLSLHKKMPTWNSPKNQIPSPRKKERNNP